MNKLIAVGIVATILAACLSTCIAIADDAMANHSVVAPPEESRDIVVLTAPANTASYDYDDVRFQNTFQYIGQEDIVVIDGPWLENQDQTAVNDEVRTLIDNGNPVILIDDSYDVISAERIGHSVGYSSSADIYVVYDPATGTSYCLSVSNSDVSEAFDTALQWMEDIESEYLIRYEFMRH